MREEYEFGGVVAQGIILSAPSNLQNIPPRWLLNSPAHQELLSSAGINTSLHYHGNADNYLQVARESRGSTDISPEEQSSFREAFIKKNKKKYGKFHNRGGIQIP